MGAGGGVDGTSMGAIGETSPIGDGGPSGPGGITVSSGGPTPGGSGVPSTGPKILSRFQLARSSGGIPCAIRLGSNG